MASNSICCGNLSQPDTQLKLFMQGSPNITRHSELLNDQTPSLEEFKTVRHLTDTVVEPKVVTQIPASKEDLAQFYEELSTLTPSRVRFLYRQRWDICRMNPGGIPRVTDVQYLEATLRVLDDWRKQEIDVG